MAARALRQRELGQVPHRRVRDQATTARAHPLDRRAAPGTSGPGSRPWRAPARSCGPLAGEEVAGGLGAGGDHVRVVPLGVGEHLQGDAVGDREQERDDRLGVEARLRSRPRPAWRARISATWSRVRLKSSPTSRWISGLRRPAVNSSNSSTKNPGSFSIKSSRLETRTSRTSSTVFGVAERLVEAGDAELGVAADDLDQQPLLGAEVVVEQAAADARLAGDVLEGRAGDAAPGDARAHRVDDPLRLLARSAPVSSSPPRPEL